jgi:hypothetical protein
MRGVASLNQELTLTERRSLSAHQVAEPQTHIGRESRSGYCPVANLDHSLERGIMRQQTAGGVLSGNQIRFSKQQGSEGSHDGAERLAQSTSPILRWVLHGRGAWGRQLLEYYVEPSLLNVRGEHRSVADVADGARTLVLGSAGAGKTALFRSLTVQFSKSFLDGSGPLIFGSVPSNPSNRVT